MPAGFVPTFTRAGLAAVRNAQGSGLQATITALAVGAGATAGQGFAGYAPDGTETTLKHEVARAPILASAPIGGVAGGDPIGFVVRSEFPPLAAGGADVEVLEVGVFLSDGTLLCVWSSTLPNAKLTTLTPFAIFDLDFDLYLTAIPAAALAITVTAPASTLDLACLAQLLRGVAQNYTRQIKATHRLARRGIRE